jgi:hypothetical protein
MVIICPTLDLARKIGIRDLPDKKNYKSTTYLGDWYAKYVVIKRRHYIVCVSEATRLPVVLDAAPFKTFMFRFPGELSNLLSSIGITKDRIVDELSRMRNYEVSKTSNRSAIGSLNDYCRLLADREKYGSKDFQSNVERSHFLSEVPSLVMDAVFPTEAAQKAFSRTHLSLVDER